MGGTWRICILVAIALAAAVQLGLFAYQAVQRPRVVVRRAAPADVLQARWRGPISSVEPTLPCPARRA